MLSNTDIVSTLSFDIPSDTTILFEEDRSCSWFVGLALARAAMFWSDGDDLAFAGQER